MVAAERLGEMFQAEGEKRRKPTSTVERRLEGSIEFRNVGFRYGSRHPVFDDLCMRIEPGECVGIAGGSGSGKTTLVRLLGRFMEPSSGRVLIDGIDVRDYELDNLRRQVVFVSQDADLFSISIAGNVSLGRPSADAQEVRTAARLAHVDEIVNRMPLGYDTVIGERGMTLSGGERQRIALARALLARSTDTRAGRAHEPPRSNIDSRRPQPDRTAPRTPDDARDLPRPSAHRPDLPHRGTCVRARGLTSTWDDPRPSWVQPCTCWQASWPSLHSGRTSRRSTLPFAHPVSCDLKVKSSGSSRKLPGS